MAFKLKRIWSTKAKGNWVYSIYQYLYLPFRLYCKVCSWLLLTSCMCVCVQHVWCTCWASVQYVYNSSMDTLVDFLNCWLCTLPPTEQESVCWYSDHLWGHVSCYVINYHNITCSLHCNGCGLYWCWVVTCWFLELLALHTPSYRTGERVLILRPSWGHMFPCYVIIITQLLSFIWVLFVGVQAMPTVAK